MSRSKASDDQRAYWRSRIQPFSPDATSEEPSKRIPTEPQTRTPVDSQERTTTEPQKRTPTESHTRPTAQPQTHTTTTTKPPTAVPSDSFGQRLRTLRKRKKLSQVELARQISERYDRPISQANVSHLERRAYAPRQDMLNLLADFFGVPIQHFYQQLGADWPARRERIAAYLESLKHRTFLEGCRRTPVKGDRYTIYDNWWFHIGFAIED